jgi:hypothetical protein
MGRREKIYFCGIVHISDMRRYLIDPAGTQQHRFCIICVHVCVSVTEIMTV